LTEHVPVLLPEVLSFLSEHISLKRVLDCTLGLGGYSGAILSSFPSTTVYALDQDEHALSIAKESLACYGERFRCEKGNFASVPEEIALHAPFDAILFDLGVSNLQLVDGDRGFSFQADGPLDMRMDRNSPLSASTIINTYPEREISAIFWKYGEERFARQLSKGIVRYREEEGPIERTSTLVEVVRKTLPAPVQRKMGGHPARRIFQALRIAVNDELNVLNEGLKEALALAASNALVLVVSYHSLEDRIVKNTFREWKEKDRGSILTRKPVVPSEEEIERNYKSRSAKMRVFSIG
jgi:16S rRNA (cytosine1402-N4)-methyltransferase